MKTKDEIFVINQPKKSIISIVIVNDLSFPLTNTLHDNIFELEELSDVLFIFPDSTKNINIEKFANLYRSIGWIESGGNLSKTIMKTLDYCINIFENQYVGFNIVNTKDIKDEKLTNRLKDNINKVNLSSVKMPIFSISRLGPSELYDIYKDDNMTSLIPIQTKVNWKFWEKSEEDKTLEKKDSVNMFSTYKSESKVLYFKVNTIKTLVEFYKIDGNTAKFESFVWDDCRYMFASMIKYFGIDNHNCNIDDLDFSTVTSSAK